MANNLYQTLIAAGLPVLSASETGEIISKGMTEPQRKLCEDLVSQYFEPVVYQATLDERTNTAALKSEHPNALTKLQGYRDATTMTNAEVVAAIKYISRVLIFIINWIVRHA